MLKKPFVLGELAFPSNIFCAPLAGCTDFALRKMLAKYRPGLMFCEMVKMEALLHADVDTSEYLAYTDEMRPIGAQLWGGDVKLAGPSARIIEDLGFDMVNLNCGCPVKKVTKHGCGSSLLREPHLIGEMIANMVDAVKIPVTVKVRTGWDEESINIEEVTKIAESAGAKIIFVHGRTRAQGYRGTVSYEAIKRSKQAAKTISVFGNGDIFDPKSAQRMFSETHCDGILLARGMLGRPWLIEEIMRILANEPMPDIKGKQLKELFLEHFAHIVQRRSDKYALLDTRRISSWYVKKQAGAKDLRVRLGKVSSIEEVKELVDAFSWE